jgi:hypothetical protein
MTTQSTLLDERLVIRREPFGGQAELARGFELLVADLGDVKLDGHRVEIAQMVRAPAAKAEQKNFCHAKARMFQKNARGGKLKSKRASMPLAGGNIFRP